MIVRELFTKLGMDVDSAGFTEAILAADAVKKALGLMGDALAAVAKGMVKALTETAETAGQFDDLVKQTGLSRTALQELKYASEQSGTGFASMVQGLRFLARNSVEAAEGNQEMSEAFAKLGVSARDATGRLKAPESLLADMADGFAGLATENEKTNLAMTVFGRSGVELLPFLKEGRAGVEALRKEAHELGIVMSDEAIAAGDDFGDNLIRLDALWTGLKQTLAGPVLEALNETVSAFIEWAKANRAVIRENVEVWAKRLASAFRVLGRVAKAIPDILDGIKTALFLMGGALLGLAIPASIAALGGLVTALGGVTAANLTWGSAALIAGTKAAIGAALPILAWVLLGVVILAALEDLYQFFTGGQSVIGEFLAGPWKHFVEYLQKTWGDLKLIAGEFWAGIVDMGKTALDKVIAFFKALPGQIADFIPGGRVALDYWFPKGAASPASNAGMAQAATGVNVSSPKMAANFVLNVPAGTDAPQVSTAVERQLESWWNTKMAENYVALEGG